MSGVRNKVLGVVFKTSGEVEKFEGCVEECSDGTIIMPMIKLSGDERVQALPDSNPQQMGEIVTLMQHDHMLASAH